MKEEYSNKFKALILTIYTAAIAFLGYAVAPYLPTSQNVVEQTVAPTNAPVVTVEVTASPSATIVPTKASSINYTKPVAKPTVK